MRTLGLMGSVLAGSVLAAASACSKPAAPPATPEPEPASAATRGADERAPALDPCAEAEALCARHASLLADGYLHRALDAAERADRRCASQTTRLAIASALADLGLNRRAVAAYRAYAARGSNEEKHTANESITAIEKRPPPTREASEEDRQKALLLYRDGVNQRFRGKHDRSITQLRRSYALSPHPLTIVQIGLAHGAAGRAAESRRAYARALALAESTRGGRAVPRIRKGHSARVTAIAFHPDRRRLISVGWDGLIGLWDRRSGQLARAITGQDNLISALAMSRDGALLATAGNRGLRLWDPASGREVRQFGDILTGPAAALDFTPDATVLASGGILDNVNLWDVASGKKLRAFKHGDGQVTGVSFSGDGKVLAVCGRKRIELRETATGKKLRVLETEGIGILAIAFSPDGKLLASNGFRDGLVLLDPTTGAKVRTLPSKSGAHAIAFSPDGSLLAIGPMGHYPIEVWSVADARKLASIENRDLSYVSLAFSPDGSVVAGGSGETAIRFWDSTTGKEIRTLKGYGKPIGDVAFSSDGTRLAAFDKDESVKVWSLGGRTSVRALTGETRRVRTVAFSPDGARLATFGHAAAQLWNLSGDAKSVPLGKKNAQNVGAAEFSPDGALLALAGGTGPIELWDPTVPERLRELGGNVTDAKALVWSGDGKRLASLSTGPPVTIWDVASGKELRRIGPHARTGAYPAAIALHPAGDTIALAVANKIEIQRIEDGSLLAEMPLANWRSGVVSLAYSPDGARLAAGTFDRVVSIWDPAKKKRIHGFDAHDGSVDALGFAAARANILATGSPDKTVKLWDIDEGELLATLVSTPDARWLVVAPDGRADGSEKTATAEGGPDFVFWEIGDVLLPGFVGWQRYHTPGLLGELLGR